MKSISNLLKKVKGHFKFAIVKSPDSVIDDIILVYDDADIILYKGKK